MEPTVSIIESTFSQPNTPMIATPPTKQLPHSIHPSPRTKKICLFLSSSEMTHLLPNGTSPMIATPPQAVQNWIHDIGTYQSKVNDIDQVYTWLTAAIKETWRSNTLHNYVHGLLSTSIFTCSMHYLQIFQPLQQFCHEELNSIGNTLKHICRDEKYHSILGHIDIPIHPDVLVSIQSEESVHRVMEAL